MIGIHEWVTLLQKFLNELVHFQMSNSTTYQNQIGLLTPGFASPPSWRKNSGYATVIIYAELLENACLNLSKSFKAETQLKPNHVSKHISCFLAFFLLSFEKSY